MKQGNALINALQKNRKAIAIALIVLSMALFLPLILSSSDEKTIVVSSVVLIVMIFWSLVHYFFGVIKSSNLLTHILILLILIPFGVVLSLNVKMPSYLDGDGLILGFVILIQIVVTQFFAVPQLVSQWVALNLDPSLLPAPRKLKWLKPRKKEPYADLFEAHRASIFSNTPYDLENSSPFIYKLRLWSLGFFMFVGFGMMLAFVYVTGIQETYGELVTWTGIYIGFALVIYGFLISVFGFRRSLIGIVIMGVIYGILFMTVPVVSALYDQNQNLFWMIIVLTVLALVLLFIWYIKTVQKILYRNHILHSKGNLLIAYDPFYRDRTPISAFDVLGQVSLTYPKDPKSRSFVHLSDKIRRAARQQRVLFPGYVYDQANQKMELVFYSRTQKSIKALSEKLKGILKTELNLVLDKDPNQSYYQDRLVPDTESMILLTNEASFKRMGSLKLDPDQIVTVQFKVIIKDESSSQAFIETAKQMGYGDVVEYEVDEIYLNRSVIFQLEPMNDACLKLNQLVSSYNGHYRGWAVRINDRSYWAYIFED